MSAATIGTAYVWVTPAFVQGSPVDHTWVTTYDNQNTPLPDVASGVAAGDYYWFCWGSFHMVGKPPAPLRTGTIDIPYANCLVKSNADSRTDGAARGTIFTYGLDGVCHQLANQVLWATQDSSGAPLKTTGSRGYKPSVFFFGEYGLQHAAWTARKAGCSSSAGDGAGGNQMTDDQDDDFDKQARELLPVARYEELKALRTRFGIGLQESTAEKIRSMPGEQAGAAVNASINSYLQEVAKLLTPKEFEALLGFPPDESIELVDPKMVGADLGMNR